MIIYVCTIPVWTNKLAQYGNKLHKYAYMKHPFSVRYKMTGKKNQFQAKWEPVNLYFFKVIGWGRNGKFEVYIDTM